MISSNRSLEVQYLLQERSDLTKSNLFCRLLAWSVLAPRNRQKESSETFVKNMRQNERETAQISQNVFYFSNVFEKFL